ncbi:hypothetical protein WJX73_007612 [Symbiochloris irregularis]|uniref:Uncharacterized protein n=1 Tax=Symbiochloris irregularis TaxID=706552 RepID=A0AAW1NY56_9CHLO
MTDQQGAEPSQVPQNQLQSPPNSSSLSADQASEAGQEFVLQPGLHAGRVRDFIGTEHEPDLCETGCTLQHRLYFVSTTADCKQKAGNRNLDLKVDLHARCRALSPRELPCMHPDALQDAWMLLQPPGKAAQDAAQDKRNEHAGSQAGSLPQQRRHKARGNGERGRSSRGCPVKRKQADPAD